MSDGPVTRLLELEDRFDRPLREAGWIEGHEAVVPPTFDRIRRSAHGLAALGAGFAFAYRDLGTRSGSFAVDWTGHPDRCRPDGRVVPQHVEATPLVHVDPTTETIGVGAWPFRGPGGRVAWLVGTIGRRPDLDFTIRYAGVSARALRPGTPREIRLDTTGTHAVLRVDGVVQPLQRWDRRRNTVIGPVVERFPIPAELRRSTCHGFAIDSHLTTHRSTPGLTAFRATWAAAPTSTRGRRRRRRGGG